MGSHLAPTSRDIDAAAELLGLSPKDVPIVIRRERDATMPQAELVDLLMRYEDGNIDERDGLRLFAELITSDQAWTLQGAYGRIAHDLIEGGYITWQGDLTGKTQSDL